jgi:hypothetical protein
LRTWCALRACGTFWTCWTSWTRRTGWSIGTRSPRGSLWSDCPLCTDWPRGALRPGWSSRTIGTSWAYGTRGTLRTCGADRAIEAVNTLWTGRALATDGTLRTRNGNLDDSGFVRNNDLDHLKRHRSNP